MCLDPVDRRRQTTRLEVDANPQIPRYTGCGEGRDAADPHGRTAACPRGRTAASHTARTAATVNVSSRWTSLHPEPMALVRRQGRNYHLWEGTSCASSATSAGERSAAR